MDSQKRLYMVVGIFVLLLGTGGVVWLMPGSAPADSNDAVDDTTRRVRELDHLARSDSDAARNALMDAVAADDQQLARTAVQALAVNRSDQTHAFLLDLAESDVDPALRGAALGVLGSYEQTDPQLLADHLNGEQANVRAGAALGLTAWNSRERFGGMNELVRALRDGDPQVRRWAISAIHRVTVTRFPYDASVEPGKQRRQIRHIERWCRQRGLID